MCLIHLLACQPVPGVSVYGLMVQPTPYTALLNNNIKQEAHPAFQEQHFFSYENEEKTR